MNDEIKMLIALYRQRNRLMEIANDIMQQLGYVNGRIEELEQQLDIQDEQHEASNATGKGEE